MTLIKDGAALFWDSPVGFALDAILTFGQNEVIQKSDQSDNY